MSLYAYGCTTWFEILLQEKVCNVCLDFWCILTQTDCTHQLCIAHCHTTQTSHNREQEIPLPRCIYLNISSDHLSPAGFGILKSFFFFFRQNISIQADRFKNGPLFNPVFPLTHFFKHSVIFAHPSETVSRVRSVHGRVRVRSHTSVCLISWVREAVRAEGCNNYCPSALPW